MSEHDIPNGGADYLSNVIKAISQGASAKQTSEQDGDGNAEPTLGGDQLSGGDLLSTLLSNPDVLSKLPTVISAIKPFMEMMGSQSAQTSAPPQGKADEKPSPSTLHHEGHDSRTALLCAMKPYLSAERRQAIDYIVKLGRLGDILKTL